MDFKATDPSDGTAEANQFVSVQLVSAAKVVNDSGDGPFGLWMTIIVGQVIVPDFGAILVLASCGPELHTYQ